MPDALRIGRRGSRFIEMMLSTGPGAESEPLLPAAAASRALRLAMPELSVELASTPTRVRSKRRVHEGPRPLTGRQEVPDFMQRDCVLQFYRPPALTSATALRSLFRYHNETVNIWSHLAGMRISYV
jgi:hypothetical protein